jgi:hypothetical protein
MFIRYYIEVPLPVAVVKQALVGSSAGWLSAVAGAAQRRGDGLLGAVGVARWAPGWGGGSRSRWASRSASPRWPRCR